MKHRTELKPKPNPEKKIWYTVKLYHTQVSECDNKGKSEKIKFQTTSKARLQVLIEQSKGGKYFLGKNCRKCGTETVATIVDRK